ncbi:MAG: hypothetical protein NVS3B26_12880 [Mycobacteriales bacterium]
MEQGIGQVDEALALSTVRAALQRRFAGRVSDEVIRIEVDQGLAEFSGASVRTFIPVLLQKKVTDRLRRTQSA